MNIQKIDKEKSKDTGEEQGDENSLVSAAFRQRLNKNTLVVPAGALGCLLQLCNLRYYGSTGQTNLQLHEVRQNLLFYV